MKVIKDVKETYSYPEDDDYLLHEDDIRKLLEIEPFDDVQPVRDALQQRAESALQTYMDSQWSSRVLIDAENTTIDRRVHESHIETILITQLVDIYLVAKMCCVDDYNKAIIDKSSSIEEIERRTLSAEIFSEIKRELIDKVSPFIAGEEVVDV